MFAYEPNPAHKKTTTAAGPPKWSPHKSACPVDLSLDERRRLLGESVPRSGDERDPVRFCVRRGPAGAEFFVTALTVERADGTVVVHGYPVTPGRPKIPPQVLRTLRDKGVITEAERRRFAQA